MKLIKPIISLLLLLTYSFGFAHNLVPHCDDTMPHEHHAPAHEHHQHFEGEKQITEHDHISHNDHFDGGVYEYLTCLMNESETPESECSIEHCFTFNVNNFSLKDVNKIQNAIVLFAVYNISVDVESNSNYFKDVEITYYLSPLVVDTPLRGPPSFSC